MRTEAQIVGNLLEYEDDRLVASVGHEAKVWSTRTWDLMTCFKGHTKPITGLDVCPESFSADERSRDEGAERYGGARLLTCSDDQTVKVWDLLTGVCLLTYRAHGEDVNAVLSLPNRCVASCADDASVHIWDMDSGHTLLELNGHTHYVCYHTPLTTLDFPISHRSK